MTGDVYVNALIIYQNLKFLHDYGYENGLINNHSVVESLKATLIKFKKCIVPPVYHEGKKL